MSPRRPSSDLGDGEYVRADALAGLAREVDGLRRGLDALLGLPTRVDDLTRTTAQLADAIAATPARPSPAPAPSWIVAPTEPEVTRRLLDGLCGWLRAVFLRYPDGAAVLPACWLWHPEVVEELLWLMHAWLGAYQGSGASVQLAGDWHDRQRPGVVRRLRTAVASCSPERHQTRVGWTNAPSGAVAVPGADAIGPIATWWATGRDRPAPEPRTTPPNSAGVDDVLNGSSHTGASPR